MSYESYKRLKSAQEELIKKGEGTLPLEERELWEVINAYRNLLDRTLKSLERCESIANRGPRDVLDMD